MVSHQRVTEADARDVVEIMKAALIDAYTDEFGVIDFSRATGMSMSKQVLSLWPPRPRSLLALWFTPSWCVFAGEGLCRSSEPGRRPALLGNVFHEGADSEPSPTKCEAQS